MQQIIIAQFIHHYVNEISSAVIIIFFLYYNICRLWFKHVFFVLTLSDVGEVLSNGTLQVTNSSNVFHKSRLVPLTCSSSNTGQEYTFPVLLQGLFRTTDNLIREYHVSVSIVIVDKNTNTFRSYCNSYTVAMYWHQILCTSIRGIAS